MNLKKKIRNGVAQDRGVDSAISQNLNKKELCEAPENSPASWCKKSGEASSSASADFLLEVEKRGSPPKSEKRQLLARRGSGAGGAALLREKTQELNQPKDERFAESNATALQDESTPKVGIVIPIYNVAKYLRECLDSVANQTYKNFYAVLVNDGSTDESKQIALDFVAKDSRFVLIDKENGGLSSARNAGINYFNVGNSVLGMQFRTCENFQTSTDSSLVESPKIFTNTKATPQFLEFASVAKQPSLPLRFCESQNLGENQAKFAESSLDSATIHTHKNTTPNPPQIDYIIFLDSDDFWEANLLQTCVDSAKSQNLDIVWFGFKAFGAKVHKRDPLDLFAFQNATLLTAQEWLNCVKCVGLGQFWFSWQGLINFKFLCEKKLQFLESALYEDELFGVQVFAQSRAIVALPKKLYHYRIRENSLASNAKRKSLPPNLSHLREHFSDENIAWEYFCASSFAKILIEFIGFTENLQSQKVELGGGNMSFANALKEAFLPTLFARSCDILAFKCDPYLLKARVVALLKEYRRYFSALKLIAKIPQKRARYTIFLSYFAPRLVWFRIKKRIKLLFVAESSLDSAELQNLNENNRARSAHLESRPLRGAKNREQGRSSASADFLLEAEKRGSPPKSEKRQLLGTYFKKVGGSGAGGVALLREESSENNGEKIAESTLDSANLLAMTKNKDSVDSAKLGDLRG